MQSVFQDEISLCIVEAVRKYFSTNELTTDWKWSPDEDKTKITIVDSWPDMDRLGEERTKGLIVLSASFGSSEEMGFGQAAGKMQDEDGNNIGQYSGGRVTFNVSYDAVTYSKRDTKRLADLLAIGLLSEVPTRVAITTLNNLLLDLPRISNGGERQERITDQTMLWINNLTQRWQSFWKGEIVFSEEILTYLLTAERVQLEGGTQTVLASVGS